MSDAHAEPAPPMAAAVTSAPPASTSEPSPPGVLPIDQVLAAGALTGLVAAAATALLDGLWSWGALDQFLPGAGGRLRLVLYLASIYGLVGLALGAATAGVALLYLRVTRLGPLLRHAQAEHARVRARDPRDALTGLSLALAFVPLATACLYGAYVVLFHALATRKHPGLVIAIAMGGGVAALALALAAAVLWGRALEVGLRALARGRLAGPLSSPLAPVVAAAGLVALGGAVIVGLAWPTLKLLPLRPFAVALVAVALATPAAWVGRRAAARWRQRAAGVRAGAAIGLPLATFAVAALTGGSPAVIKAAVAYSGGGDAITRVLKRTFDLDRDGHSALFGGDDCDDFDRSVHPGAPDIPDDGIDQNCVAGDARSQRSVDEVGFAPVPASVPADFNVVLVTIDTLRADHVGAYGYARPTTPNLDAAAAEGAVFTSGWAHAPSTRYSIPAILTGRLPLDVYYDTSVQGWPGLLPRATTIAEVLKSRGFATGAITNYWYFDRVRRMDQGFDSYDNQNAALHVGGDPAHTRGSSSAQQTDKALGFVAAHADRRFFLWVHYYDPHHEYQAHPGLGPAFGTRQVDLYDDEIRFTDHHLGRLFDDLRRRGLWDKTIVVVTGDHGEGFGEHGIQLHGYDLYAAQTKVPIIVRVPGLAPRRVATAAGHVDLLPTLANLAGAPASTEMMGRSLLPWLAGADDDLERAVFQQVSYEGNHEKRGAATARCHVLYNVSPHTSWELYQVDRDPAETRDVSAAPGPCASARRTFERWYDSAQIPAGAADALLSARPAIARPLEIELGPAVRLIALDHPATVKAGDTFELTWTYEARGRLAAGWKVFVHFEGPGRFTADHPPVRPFEWWKPGQYIRYTTTVSVPRATPPGRYAMWTGLWRKAARQKVRAPAGVPVVSDRVQATTIEVVP